METEDNKIGLIAGEGDFPIILAQSLKNKNYEVIAICFSNNQKEKLKKLFLKFLKFLLVSLESLLKFLKKEK